MSAPKIKSLLLVCAGNICRSPMAEALFRHRLKDRPTLVQIEVESAGTIAYEGNLPCAGSVDVMHETFGLSINTHRARAVTKSATADLILTMDRRTTDEVKAIGVKVPVEMLGDFAGTGEEVDDPYGGSRRAYRRAAEQLDKLVDAAIERMATEVATSPVGS